MQTVNNKRSYSPQFSNLATVSVRRLAWAMGVSMPAAVNIMVRLMPLVVKGSKVCQVCKDKTKCHYCSFLPAMPQQEQNALWQFLPNEQAALEAVL
jgi:hypothetical protein